MITLRRALLANSIFSIVSGASIGLFAHDLASVLEVPSVAMTVLGAGVFVFGVLIAFRVASDRITADFGAIVVALDVMWVVGSIALLLVPGLVSNGWVVAVVAIPVAGLATWQLYGLAHLTREVPRRIETVVDIEASPEEVWSHLTDFHSYAEWNPFILSAGGRAEIGETLALKMRSGRRTMDFSPVVTSVEPARTLEWLGALGRDGVFDGRHRFDVSHQAGRTRLVHAEEFTGLLVPFVWSSIGSTTEAGFEAMNDALRQRVEGDLRHSH